MTTSAPLPAVDRSHFDGRLLTPGSREYDSARSVWNGMIDHRPKLIVRCASVGDVAAAVRTARERDLEIGVRCGGHNIAGHAVPDGGLMIDLTGMGQVSVDPVRRRARVQGGAAERHVAGIGVAGPAAEQRRGGGERVVAPSGFAGQADDLALAGRDRSSDLAGQERLADTRRALDDDAGPGGRAPLHHGHDQVADGLLDGAPVARLRQVAGATIHESSISRVNPDSPAAQSRAGG